MLQLVHTGGAASAVFASGAAETYRASMMLIKLASMALSQQEAAGCRQRRITMRRSGCVASRPMVSTLCGHELVDGVQCLRIRSSDAELPSARKW